MYNAEYIHTSPIINQLIMPLFSPVVEHFAVLRARTGRTIVVLKSVQQEIAGGTVAEGAAGLAVEEQRPRYYVERGMYCWKAETEMICKMSYYVG